MIQVNHKERVVTAKIVYYGPALGGKTTNLEAIHRITDPEQRNTLVSLRTEGDRTLFFDLLPFDLGSFLGFRFVFKLYTVPGQIKYTAIRKKVLEGADGVVFVADSQRARAEENQKGLTDLRMNLQANGLSPDHIPLVLQYNKQDLPDLSTVNELNADLNGRKVPFFNAVAIRGKGVLETLAAIITETIQAIVSSSGIHFQTVKEKEIGVAVERILAPYRERAKGMSGEFRAVTSRLKEVHISTRNPDGSIRPDGPIRDDWALETVDLLGRSVQSSLTMAEDYSQMKEVEKRIEKMRRDLAVLGEVSAKANDGSDFDKVLSHSLEVAMGNTGADGSSILLVSSNTKNMGEKIVKGFDRDPLNALIIEGVGSLAYQYAQRKQTVITNRVQDTLLYGKNCPELEGLYGLASCPLVAKSMPLGLMNLYMSRPGKQFDREEELFLITLSNILGLYLLNSFYALKLKAVPSAK